MKHRPLRPGLLVEGNSDERYLKCLIEKQLGALVAASSPAVEVYGCEVSDIRTTASARLVADEADSLARDCDLLFLHCDADAAGRAREFVDGVCERGRTRRRYAWPIALVPVLMTESWILADRDALTAVVPGIDLEAYPYAGPMQVEKHVSGMHRGRRDVLGPKQVWSQLLGRQARDVLREDAEILVHRTDLNVLEKVPSYRAWREETEGALTKLGYLRC